MNRRYALATSMLLAAVATVTGGCAAPTEEKTDGEPSEVAASSDALGAFNPCSSEWQLPTATRGQLYSDLGGVDDLFLSFENQLAANGARWIGNKELATPGHRAIVRVDHYRDYTKKDPRSGLWYLASVSVSALNARRAAASPTFTAPPISARELGYCLVDGTFLPNKGAGPGNAQVKQVIIEYDPRCVCREFGDPNASISVWVYDSTYVSMGGPSASGG